MLHAGCRNHPCQPEARPFSRRGKPAGAATIPVLALFALLIAAPAHAFDCSQDIPRDEWVQCDAGGDPTAFRTWSASVAGGGYIWHWGGGHRDYSGNEVLLYDTSEDQWEQATTNETWRGNSEAFDSSLVDWTEETYGPDCYTEAEQDAIQSAFRRGGTQRDEETLRGRPFVRHVYHDRMFWPKEGLFCTGVSGFWCYDPTKGDLGGTDNDCKYSASDNDAWTKYTDENIQEPPGQRNESSAYTFDAELDGGSLVVFGGAEGHKVKKSTNGKDWSFVSDGIGGEFEVGGSGAWGTTITAYAENRGVHFVGKSVDKGPTNDAWYQVDLINKISTQIPDPLEAAGVSSGITIGLSYDPGTRTLLVYGAFDGEKELWQYDPDSATWAELELAGSIPTATTSGHPFDYLNYDATTGRHYLLRATGNSAPIQVHAFRISDNPPADSLDLTDPTADSGNSGSSGGSGGGGGGAMPPGLFLLALAGVVRSWLRRWQRLWSAGSDRQSTTNAKNQGRFPNQGRSPAGRTIAVLAISALLVGCGGGGGGDTEPSNSDGGEDTGSTGSGSDQTASRGHDGCDAAKSLPTTITISNQESSPLTDAAVTFGQVFCAGAVPSDQSVQATTAAGASVPLQVDAKATHGDGSLRHAVLTADALQLQAAGSPLELQLDVADSEAAGSGAPLTAQDLIDAGFDATISVTLAGPGKTFTASAADLLQNAASDGQWLDGPAVTEWLLRTDLHEQGTTNAHPHLHARFHVRAYSSDRVRVAVILENGWTFEPAPQNYTYDLEVQIEGANVLAETGVEHHNRARWRRVFWTGSGAPPLHIAHDTEYLMATGAVPNYETDLTISDAQLDGLLSRYQSNNGLMDNGTLRTNFTGSGWGPQIGPLPRWTIWYLLTQDARAKRAMLGNAEQGGAYGVHFRSRETGLPVSIDKHPGLNTDGWTGRDLKFPAGCATNASCADGYRFDKAHQPSNNYVPYLVTGDYYFLEQMHFWSAQNLLAQDPRDDARGGDKGIVRKQQVRGQGWTLRNLAHAAYITPDRHPMKSYWEEKLANNAQWYTDTYVRKTRPDFPWTNDLGWVGRGQLASDPDHIKPWMDAFVTWATGHITNGLGYANWREFHEWKSRFPINRVTGNNWCWINAGARVVDISPNDAIDSSASDGVSDGVFDNLLDVYKHTARHDQGGNACFTTDPGSDCGRCTIADGQGDPDNPIRQFAKLVTEVAAAADSGTPGAHQAWERLCTRDVKPTAAEIANKPNFAVRPRSFICP